MEVEQTTQPETATALAELRLIRDGTETGDAFPLGEKSIIGRSDPVRGDVDVDLGGLPEGGYVSRHHAEIWRDGDTWFIKDLASSNGTFLVEGEEQTKVGADTELEDSQTIMLGNVIVCFHVSPAQEDAAEEPKAAIS